MVGFLQDPTIEDDLNQQPSKLKSSDDGDDPLPLELSVSELEDFSLSFADSFLDFDSLRDWIEENPVLDMADIKPESENVDSVKEEVGAIEGSVGMDKDGSCREITFGVEFQKLGNLDSSIEREIEKVSLEGGLDGLVVSDENGRKSLGIAGGDGICVMSGPPESFSDNGTKSVEILGVNDNDVKNSEMTSVDGGRLKSGETLVIDESGRKSGEIVAIDGDGSRSDESDSTSDSDTASSSSASSASGSEEEEEEDEEEEEEGTEELEKEKEENKVERVIDMEEGEIRDSDVEQMVAWSDDDEDGGDGIMKGPIRSKNELKVLPPVPPVNVTLQPHHQTLPVGAVLSIMGDQVIVEGVEKHNPLNEGSILWITESNSPLGLVDEIFGPVKNPYYIIRYNSENEVPAGVKQGTSISFVPEFASHVLNDKNLYKKGYDASGENDEELSDEAEFSDDEKEAEYRRMLKMSKRGTNDPKLGNQKKDRKKFKNRGRTWKNGQPSTPQTPKGVHQQPTNQNQHFIAPLAASLDHGSSSHSFGTDQGFVGGPGVVPSFPQLAQAPGFIPPPRGVWTNGMPCQQQQGMVFPNVDPTSGLPWPQQNYQHQYYQMPLLNRMPFQQQFVPSQGLSSNLVLPGAQSNFPAGPAFAPWLGCLGQTGFNPPFGMAFQSQQQGPMSMNVGEQQRPPIPPGNTEVPQKFNQGMYRGRGRKPYQRGGGRFGGGRGRQQSK